MNNSPLGDFFGSALMSLPKAWNYENNDIIGYLREQFDLYEKLIKKLSLSTKTQPTSNIDSSFLEIAKDIYRKRDQIKELSKKLISVFDKYLSGKVLDATKSAYELFDNNKDQIEGLVYSAGRGNDDTVFYRMRSSEQLVQGIEQIFHVPFQKRHIISSLRYSIPGIPCLYIGSSSYLCWEELGRPDFKNVYISKFICRESTKIINLSFLPQAFGRELEIGSLTHFSRSDYIVALAALWPLILCLSLTKKNEGAPFHIEYILPQMFLQWVIENNIADGIRYASTKIVNQTHSRLVFGNYCFPVRTNNSIGYCSTLKDKFLITEPVNWELILKMNVPGMPGTNNTSKLVVMGSGTVLDYANSEFFDMEEILNNEKIKVGALN